MHPATLARSDYGWTQKAGRDSQLSGVPTPPLGFTLLAQSPGAICSPRAAAPEIAAEIANHPPPTWDG
jgi:hypothetical protein